MAASRRVKATKLSAKFEGSFAYKTIKDRLPIILSRAIDALCRDKLNIDKNFGAGALEESKTVIGRLAKLRNEVVTNKPVLPIEDDFEDASIWNEYLNKYTAKHGTEPKWFEAPWLYVECYMYRRIFEAFQLASTLRSYDPFRLQKEEALAGALDSIRVLADYVKNNTHEDAALETLQPFVKGLVEVSLWGNQCDLSISGGAPVAIPSTALSGCTGMNNASSNLLCDHFRQLWGKLCQCRQKTSDWKATSLEGNDSKPALIHIVLDNAGYEFVSDLALLDYLQETGFIGQVTLHIKAMPWFVSDVTRHDLVTTIRQLHASDHDATVSLAARCRKRLDEGLWTVEEDLFWTTPYPYYIMKNVRPDLHANLAKADLIIFKGDLNYRKLVGDRAWKPNTSLETALEGFFPSSLCALRTIKADTVAGLDEGVAQMAAAKASDWMTTGQFALLQCVLR